MSYKRLFSFALCLLFVFLCTGCKKDNAASSQSADSKQSVFASNAQVTDSSGNSIASGNQAGDKTTSSKKTGTSVTSKKVVITNSTVTVGGSGNQADNTSADSVPTSSNPSSSYPITFTPSSSSSSAASSSAGSSSKVSSSVPAASAALADIKTNWTKTFDDEFTGNSLNMNNWAYPPEWTRDICVWHRNAATVKDGNLFLMVINNNLNNNAPYLAGAVRTQGKFEQTYGYYEVSCKSPTVKGVNAAFWFMGGQMNKKVVAGGYDGVEVDVLETYDISHRLFQHALHWDGYGADHRMTEGRPNILKTINIYDGNYHKFGFLWTPTEYVFYVDDKETWRPSDPVETGGICRVPLYMKLTLGVGGSWIGEPDPKDIPITGMIIDYVKVWKNPNL